MRVGEIEDGYEVAYDLTMVLTRAEAAVAADPLAAFELAADGSCLRFTAGDPEVICTLEKEDPPSNVVWMRLSPLTWRAAKSDGTHLDMMHHLKRNGAVRLRFVYSPRVTGGWHLTGNPWIDQRRHMYALSERYMVLPMTSPTHYSVLDLATGLVHREGKGRAGKQAGLEEMTELCARLNAEANATPRTPSS
ncbi:hypothetical protein ABZ897_57755 [Nonomuraea sp. NPDC046802]|uniref:hypothetical protein n=1 Tax=Nonomuraea sp. NPDC046802 TaxID=3154919 RepID=UPI003402B731